MQSALASSAVLAAPGALAAAAEWRTLPVTVFSKVYQTLNLDFEAAAEVTAEAGLDGVDCPVRPGGEVLPEKVQADLPRYAEALRRRKLGMPLLTTAITSASSPHAEDLLRTARSLGVQYYRLGFVLREEGVPREQQLQTVKANLKTVAELSRRVGLGAIFQNHSPSGRQYMGGNLNDMFELVKDFDPAQIGVAFDIGHALVVHGEDWRAHLDKLKPYIKVAYVKDVKAGRDWVPFGEGQIARTDFFKLLKQIGYNAPFSLHIEFDWTEKGKSKNRAALVKALKSSTEVLRRWVAEA